jgi:pimeloyl-ACP methyl ester carboxylesterase
MSWAALKDTEGELMAILTVNGAELYHELRGDGPPAMFIMGATGDGGHFERVADLLSDEFTVVTYDRRGNGRSPRPAGWETTSPEEQADDAAALLDALGLAPAVVFGTSSGGLFALCLLIRHPEAVRGALLHEPALVSLFDDPEAVRKTVGARVTAGMDSGGPPAALEQFARFVAGDANWDRLEPSLRERMLASAETYLGVEIARFDTWLPADEALAAVAAPVQVVISEDSHPFFAQAADRLAERLGAKRTRTPGTHFPYLDHPQELAQTIRPFLREFSGVSA